jgi:hypothetical protein
MLQRVWGKKKEDGVCVCVCGNPTRVKRSPDDDYGVQCYADQRAAVP